MTNKERIEQSRKRILSAVNLEEIDRAPVIPSCVSFPMLHVGGSYAPMFEDPLYSTRCIIQTFQEIGLPDALQHVGMNPYTFCLTHLSKVMVPGKELAHNELWQIDEKELMTVDDYKEIIDKGYNQWFYKYLVERLDDPIAKLTPFFQSAPTQAQMAFDAGILLFSPMFFTSPFESFCGGRSIVKFSRDLYKHYDLVKEALEVALADVLQNIRNTVHGTGIMAAWMSGLRSASEFLAPKFWDVFVYPYYKAMAETLLSEGVIPLFHMDSCWDRDVEAFLDMPKGCIFATDGMTDIFRAKKILDGHMCVMGDVPASLLAIGTPAEVKAYCDRLLDELGPKGFILTQGCDMPPNAKQENIVAMMEAAMSR